MNEIELVLYFAIAAFAAWWLFFVEYRSYLLAKARQDLFSVRDELFAAAERGDLAFDSRAYRMTRQLLNGGINAAHRLSLMRVIGIIVANTLVRGPKARSPFAQEYAAARQELNDAGRKAVDIAHSRMHIILMRYVVMRSLFLIALNVITLLWIGARETLKRRILRNRRWAFIDMEMKWVAEGRSSDDDIVHA